MTLRFLSQHYVTGFTRRGRKPPFCWGSLVADMSRGIAYISYDGCGNPNAIYFTDGSVTKYSYSATGQKLGVEYRVAAPNVSNAFGVEPDALSQAQTLYAGSKQYGLGGSLIFKDGMTDRYLFDGGYAKATMVSPTNYHFAFYFYNRDHLGNIREVVNSAGTVCQVINYYPSGVPYTETNSVMNAGLQPYKYNGKELDRMHGLDTYDYGARQYNPIVGRWDRMDPLCEKYYSVSPYAYCGGNPVNAIDTDGKDVFLLIWATYNGHIGHAGVAISNYKEERIKINGQWTSKMVPDGTYTYRDLWPGGAGVGKNNFNQDVSAIYQRLNVSYNDILREDVSESEGVAADGVVKIPTSFDVDQKVQKALDKYESDNPNYNALTNNCSDYAEVALESIVGKQLPVDEKISSKIIATTPNQLYYASRKIKGNNLIVDPKDKVNNGFIHGASGGLIKEWKANKELEK